MLKIRVFSNNGLGTNLVELSIHSVKKHIALPSAEIF